MSRLIWTPPALADVQRLYRFLAPKNADAAQRAVKAIRTGVKILAHDVLRSSVIGLEGASLLPQLEY